MPEVKKRISIGSEYRDTYANLVKILRSGELESAGATEFARNFKELENKVFFA